MTPANQTEPLQYRAPSPARRRMVSSVAAVLLALPGAVCWALLLAAITGIINGPHRPWFVFAVLLTWAIAVATGVTSLALLLNRPKNWACKANLAVNAPGLLFTLGAVGWYAYYVLR